MPLPSDQAEFLEMLRDQGVITNDQVSHIADQLEVVSRPPCKACNTNTHAASRLQPLFCTECVNAMLRGCVNRFDPSYLS